MDRRTLGKDLEVSALGFGCVGISHGYGNALPREEGSARIWQTFDAGVTFFDTAKCYGPYTNDRTGIPTRFRLVRGLGHGFGIGIGTPAEGWLDDALKFWLLHAHD